MERAVAYIRVSTDRQAKDGTSLVTQRKRVLEYSTVKSYELLHQFVEEGESAKTDDRPVLQEMLQFCKKNRGRIDVLIFPKIDRFARYAADYHFLKGFLKDLGIRVESIDERFDDSPAGRFLESLLAATAQFDNDVRSERAFNGMKEAVSQGRWAWGAPRGYRNVRIGSKATIEPDPTTAPLISQAFDMLATRECRPKDARTWLASQGVKISRSQFHRMIYNKAYIGVIEAFGITQQAASPFLPLISEATFYRAQESFRPRRGPRVYQRDNPDFPLRGTVRCPCGRLMTAGWAKGKTLRYAYYRCKDCPRMNVRRVIVENQFRRLLAWIAQKYRLTPDVKAELVNAWEEDQAARVKRRAHLEKDLASLTDLQKAIAVKNVQGVLPDALARDQIEELEQKLIEKRAQFQELQTDEINIRVVLNHGERFLLDLRRFWRDSDMSVKKHVQRFFFPEGATVEIQNNNATPRNGPTTGLRPAPAAALSHLARPAHKSPNPKFPDSRYEKNLTISSRREMIQLFIVLYREFSG